MGCDMTNDKTQPPSPIVVKIIGEGGGFNQTDDDRRRGNFNQFEFKVPLRYL